MAEMPPYSVRVGNRVVQFPLVLWLTVLWVLMWDRPSIANAVSGLVLALLLVLVFPMPPIDPGLRLHPVGLVRFVVRLTLDLLYSAGPLAWQAVGAGRPTVNSVLAVQLRTRSDLIMTVTAITLAATPGTVVVDVRRGDATLFLHVLGADDDETVARARRDVLAQEERVVRAFGTRDDRRALAEARRGDDR
ncbi:Na+/H+ antiporter subunit E [Actinomadura hibisca]|uniref:Na+/H+ antiporter subunit E n=1 Tax=Actinomadura hibisca TaxID=68565 RepID=UPI00082B6053|nr:Na+/H+ antiporter subunit E [Actinomadura hibisca]